MEVITNAKIGYKRSKMGLIPVDWDLVLIKDLVSKELLEKPLDGNHGNIHPKSKDFVSSGIPFIMANNIVNSEVDYSNCSFITKQQADNLQKGFSINGDVLLTHKGTVGNVAIVSDLETPYIMLTPQVTYYRVKNSNVLDNRYIKHFFGSNYFQRILESLSGGGTRAYIGITKQLDLPFLLPPTLAEQQAIASALSDVDALISSLDKLIAKKKAIKAGAMQELLTGRKRLEGFGEGMGYKETEVGRIPEDWEVRRLHSFGSFSKGRGIKKDEVRQDGLPCIRYGEIYTKHEDYIKEFYSFIDSKVASESHRLKRGDLLFAGSGETKTEIGKCVAFTGIHEAYAGGDIVILSLKEGHSTFLGFLMNTPMVVKQKASKGQGDAVVHISAGSLGDIKVAIPQDILEQEKIAKVLMAFDQEIKILQKRKSKTQALKEGMMQELLTGKTRLI